MQAMLACSQLATGWGWTPAGAGVSGSSASRLGEAIGSAPARPAAASAAPPPGWEAPPEAPPAEDMRGRRHVRQRLGDRALGDPAELVGNPLRRVVGRLDVGGIRVLRVLLGLEAHAAHEPLLDRPQADVV